MTGYATTLRAPDALRERFESKAVADPDSGCHTWTAYVGSDGYGRFKAEGRMWVAHRVAYVLANGDVPAGLELDHLCRNRSCVNPAHLEPVTKFENQVRSPLSFVADQVARTRCPRGHENYAVRCDGARVCRTCVNARNRARRARMKAAAA